MTTTLSSEELAEFTVLNALAWDLARVRAGPQGMIPFWLTTSPEARERYVQDFLVYLHGKTGKAFTRDAAAILVEGLREDKPETIKNWMDFELEAKQLREQGDPTAFFAPGSHG